MAKSFSLFDTDVSQNEQNVTPLKRSWPPHFWVTKFDGKMIWPNIWKELEFHALAFGEMHTSEVCYQ